MPTIKDKLRFNYNGVWSDTYGLINVVQDNGLYEEKFIAQREIVETKIRGNSKPLFHSLEDMPLEFEMHIAFQEGFDDNKLDSIIRWLFVDNFKPLYFEDNENKVFYCMPISDSTIAHNGIGEGYFTITMRCDSSYAYSPVTTSTIENVTTSKTITIVNNGHFDIYPEISLYKKGNGTIVIESLDDYDVKFDYTQVPNAIITIASIFEIRDLTDLEDIYLNCEKEIIETDAVGVYRYDKIIGDFPRLLKGTNRFVITGDCDIQFRYKEKYRF